MQELEVGKHLKKKKSNTSKAKNKSNHKHEYKEVLLMIDGRPHPAKMCIICGKKADIKYFVTERVPAGWRVLSDKQIYEKWKDVEIIEEGKDYG